MKEYYCPILKKPCMKGCAFRMACDDKKCENNHCVLALACAGFIKTMVPSEGDIPMGVG